MMITRDYYETFFLDYLDGKLEENMIDEFLDFLKQNPDLKEELHLLENIHLPEQQVVFSGKKHLYKSVADEKAVLEIKSIALMEGDLREDERELFEVYLANHPNLQKEHELFAKTHLRADTDIKYPDKKKLYRKSGTAILLNWVVSVAAMVLIFYGIHSVLQNDNHNSLTPSIEKIASVKQESVPSKSKNESMTKLGDAEPREKLANKAKSELPGNHKLTRAAHNANPAIIAPALARDLTVLEEINPIRASIKVDPIENQLAEAHSVNMKPIRDPRKMMTLDEYLASRVKEVGDEGLLSANKIIRIGLNVASELSGNRIGYRLKNGKISSLEFESKLLAFSIPLEKK